MKDIAIIILSILLVVLFLENADLKKTSRMQQVGYEKFLNSSYKGNRLKDHIFLGSLGVILDENQEAVVCGRIATGNAKLP